MKAIYHGFLCMALALGATACQDKDIDRVSPLLSPIEAEAISGSLQGDDYVWTWTPVEGTEMLVNVYSGNTLLMAETAPAGSFTHPAVDTNQEFTYVFKLTDGTNLSKGVVKTYTRPGASRMTGLSISQVEKAAGYDAQVEWEANPSATQIRFSASNGKGRDITETLSASSTGYLIPNVTDGEEWNVTLVATNNEGSSLPVSSSLKIGKTAIGFLSVYPTPEQLVSDGDDDEASAWLWLHETYPTARYLYFGDIASAADLDNFRVLFWIRDIELSEDDFKALEAEGRSADDVIFTMPDVVADATPAIAEWYAAGGSLLLWSHATVYVGELGRLPITMLRGNDHAIGCGEGGINGDTWSMAVSLNPAGAFTKDHSSHPIYRGLTVNSNDRCKLVPFKGPGWTEDHNCLFFNIPSDLTGLGNQEEACYNALTSIYGIYPLGTWDSQIDFISQLNVWEAQPGNTEFKGTILCIGNGGCEFSMKNSDGTPDKSAKPKNNQYQDNVLTLAKNSLEYLKTR